MGSLEVHHIIPVCYEIKHIISSKLRSLQTCSNHHIGFFTQRRRFAPALHRVLPRRYWGSNHHRGQNTHGVLEVEPQEIHSNFQNKVDELKKTHVELHTFRPSPSISLCNTSLKSLLSWLFSFISISFLPDIRIAWPPFLRARR